MFTYLISLARNDSCDTWTRLACSISRTLFVHRMLASTRLLPHQKSRPCAEMLQAIRPRRHADIKVASAAKLAAKLLELALHCAQQPIQVQIPKLCQSATRAAQSGLEPSFWIQKWRVMELLSNTTRTDEPRRRNSSLKLEPKINISSRSLPRDFNP